MDICLDRFSSGLADTQDEIPVLECAACGYELYSGEEYFDVDGHPCCRDADCMVALAGGIDRRTA